MKLLSCFLSGILVPFLVFTCFAQKEGASSAPAFQPQDELIDGSREPHRIPDNVAWLMLFRALADGPKAFSYDVRASYLKNANLTPDQIQDS